MYKPINVCRHGLLGVITAMLATVTTSLPAKAAFIRYGFASGDESIRLDSDALNSLEAIGLKLDRVESLATPAPGFEYAWKLLPPTDTPGERGTNFEFFYEEETNTFIPIPTKDSGTFEYNGSIFFEVDPTKFNLASPLQLGEISAFVDESFESFVTDTVTTNLPIWEIDLDLEEALIADIDNLTMSFDPIDLFFTEPFADFLIDAALTPEIADQVANLVPDLKLGELRGDRNIFAVEPAPVPESSSTLALILLGVSGIATHIIRQKKINRSS